MAWTTAAEFIAAWIGDDAPSDTTKIDLWIGKAEREIRHRLPDIQARIDAEAELDPAVTELLENAKDVTITMVARVFRNPDGRRSVNSTTGPFTDTVTYGGDTPGLLQLLDSEYDKLSGQSDGGGQAFTISMIPSTSRFSPDYNPNWWEL